MKKYVIGRIQLKPGVREEYLVASRAYAGASRKEAGCLYYHEARDVEDPDRTIVVECWENPDRHAAHLKQPHYKAFVPKFEAYIVSATFEEMNVDDINTVAVSGH